MELLASAKAVLAVIRSSKQIALFFVLLIYFSCLQTDLEFTNNGSEMWKQPIYLFCKLPGAGMETIQLPLLEPGQSFQLPVPFANFNKAGDHVLNWDIGRSGVSYRKLFIHYTVKEEVVEPKVNNESVEIALKLKEMFPKEDEGKLIGFVTNNQNKTLEELSNLLLSRENSVQNEQNH